MNSTALRCLRNAKQASFDSGVNRSLEALLAFFRAKVFILYKVVEKQCVAKGKVKVFRRGGPTAIRHYFTGSSIPSISCEVECVAYPP